MKASDDQILAAIDHLTADKGYPPTVREIGDAVGLKVASIQRRLDRLYDFGLILREPGIARSIRVTEAGR